MSSVTFWFGWFLKAFWTMPEFLGGNWIGAIFAFAWVFFYQRRKVFNLETFRAAAAGREKFRVLGGFLMDHWKNTLGLWLCILGAFLVAHTLDLVYHNADSISAKNGELSKTISINAETCESEKNQLRLTGATEKTRADTLSKQNLDQQNTINSCLTQAMKLLTQEPLIITKLPILPDLDHQGPGIHTVHLLVLTNKTIPTVRIKAECNHAISSGNGELIGGNMLSEGAVINPPNVLHVSVDSPSWTPTRPLLINMTYSAPKDDLRCSVDQN